MSLFYDTLIGSILFVTGLLVFFVARDRWMRRDTWASRHARASAALLGVLVLGWATVAWGSFVEPRLLIVRRISMPLPASKRLPVRLRIALVSDFHVGAYKDETFVRRVVGRILGEDPDLALIAGDHILNDGEDGFETKLKPLGSLASTMPTIAVFGNHEYGFGGRGLQFDPDRSGEVAQMMDALGVTVLRNSSTLFAHHGASIAIAGVDDWEAGQMDVSKSLEGIPPEPPLILLAHNPSVIYDTEGRGVDVVFAGHMHGGQVALPFVGPIGASDTIVPRKYWKGLWEWWDGSTKMYVTSGLGESGPRARLWNPPEIVIVTLQ